eukprot:TRINITY_DN7144_c0_g1_i1.p1 TRINITY_DN7144_c0_g1~~TRINITY_DN7144_c0_g1_i1.p1  ORF type:complete len:526 (-),score=89.05 TRINITY_DN7144_c0_g1_i1:139-1716(-)
MPYRKATAFVLGSIIAIGVYWRFLDLRINHVLLPILNTVSTHIENSTANECQQCPSCATLDSESKENYGSERFSIPSDRMFISSYPPLSRQRLRRDAAPPPPPPDLLPAWEPFEEIINKRCPKECSRNGICDRHGKCNCEHGYSGDACEIRHELKAEYGFKNFPNGPTPYSSFSSEFSCHEPEIDALVDLELSIFREGMISRELLAECVKHHFRCVRIQIIDNVVYRISKKPPTPNRWRRWKRLIVSFARRVKIPNTEFVICFDDRPVVERHIPLPIFGFYKTDEHNDILIPGDFHHEYFLEGLAEMRLYESRERFPWSKKKSVAMWRGSPNGIWKASPYSFGSYHYWPRVRLSRLSIEHPHLLDAAFSGSYGGYRKDLRMPPILQNYTRRGLGMELQMKYKYLVVVDGNGSSDRFHGFLETTSVVLKPYGPYYEYFQNLPVPYKHYIPIEYDFTDLIDKIKWAKEHDEAAYRMAEHGTIWARNHLRYEEIFCYYGKMLTEYTKLLDFAPTLSPDAVRVDDVEPS